MRTEDHLARDYTNLKAEMDDRMTTLAMVFERKLASTHEFYLRRITWLWLYCVVSTAAFFLK